MDGYSGAELLVEPSCLDKGVDSETGTETGGDVMYASVLATVRLRSRTEFLESMKISNNE